MYKAILITLLLLMCLGVIVKAEPLPLVPGATYTQQSTQTKETQLQETKKEQEETKKEDLQSTAENAQENDVSKSTAQKDQQAAAGNGGNSGVISSIEAVNSKWFALESKEDGKAKALAAAVEQAGDYRDRAHMSSLFIKAKQELSATGQYSADSIRGALDALMGWDFSYGTYK